jgi:hypothetical protein
MSSSRTKIVSLDKMARDPELGSVLVRLMLVMNDFSIANDALGFWRADTSRKRINRQGDALRYLVSVQVSHVFEGMLSIISEIEKRPTLLAAVGRCDKPTQAEFAQLVAFRKTQRFTHVMTRIRNNLAFHYDANMAQKQLLELVAEHPRTNGAISMGNDVLDWYFAPGDMVRERVGVREVFKVPKGADVRLETDKILIELHEISDVFGKFAGNFVWQMTSA